MFRHEILANGDLRVVASPTGHRYLLDLNPDREEFDSEEITGEVFDFLGNFDIDGCLPIWAEVAGVAKLSNGIPLLAQFGKPIPVPNSTSVEARKYWCIIGGDGDTLLYCPIEKCWAFHEYQTISPQRALLENHECIWSLIK